MPEEIDYKGIAQGLMTELEDARRAIADLHFAKNRAGSLDVLKGLSPQAVKQFVTNNFMLIIVAIAIADIALRYLSRFISLRRKGE